MCYHGGHSNSILKNKIKNLFQRGIRILHKLGFEYKFSIYYFYLALKLVVAERLFKEKGVLSELDKREDNSELLLRELSVILISTNGGCVGRGSCLQSLLSISTTFHIGGRRLGDACAHKRPMWNNLPASSSLHCFFKAGSSISAKLFELKCFHIYFHFFKIKTKQENPLSQILQYKINYLPVTWETVHQLRRQLNCGSFGQSWSPVKVHRSCKYRLFLSAARGLCTLVPYNHYKINWSNGYIINKNTIENFIL